MQTWAAHNEYLRMAVEGGQIGRALLIGLFVLWVVRHTRALRRTDKAIMRLAFLAFAAHAYTDNVLIATTACVFFTFAIAVFAQRAALAGHGRGGVGTAHGLPEPCLHAMSLVPFSRLCRCCCSAHRQPSASGLAFMINSGGASISLVDMSAQKELRRIPVLREPHHCALSPDGKSLLVGDTVGNEMLFLDPATGGAAEAHAGGGSVSAGLQPERQVPGGERSRAQSGRRLRRRAACSC